MTSRKKPGVAFWATVVVVVALVGYPLSFGPACWLAARHNCVYPAFCVVFRPLARLADHSGPHSWDILEAYAVFGMPDRAVIFVPTDEGIRGIGYTPQPISTFQWKPPIKRI